MDWLRAERVADEQAGPVIRELHRVAPELSSIMIVGATCRDALHAACGASGRLRATDDLDLAIAVPRWDGYDALTASLRRAPGSTSGIRYVIADRIVDLMPFGEVEDPDGVVTPAPRRDPMSVFGFRDVWPTAREVRVGAGLTVRIPTIAGFVTLKLKAWADRSPYGEYKDGGDVAAAISWYQGSSAQDGAGPGVRDRLYSDDGHRHLLAVDFDEPLAVTRLLIDDAVSLLAPSRQAELGESWSSVDDNRLAANLSNPLLPGWPRSGSERLREHARAIRDVIEEECRSR